MNRFEKITPGGEAELVYDDGDFRVVRPGSFVTCAVSGKRIALDDLRYWSPDFQEAYASAEISFARYKEKHQIS